jgi:hypothetical protein
LWKGKGCSAEELGCTRLIAMDLGTTPDVAEISEGAESDAFFNFFPPLEGLPDKSVPRSADHWRHKATNDKYRCRLFRVEQHNSRSSTLQVSSFFTNLTRRTSWSSLTSPRSSPTFDEQPKTPTTPKPTGSPLGQPTTTKIVEISPFTQGDVEAGCIFVLDAFFEVYMYVFSISFTHNAVLIYDTDSSGLSLKRNLMPSPQHSSLRKTTEFSRPPSRTDLSSLFQPLSWKVFQEI